MFYLWRVIVFLLLGLRAIFGEIFTIGAIGTAVIGGLFGAWSYKDRIVPSISCAFSHECCHPPYVQSDFALLRHLLREKLYGQHLAIDTVYNSVMAHVQNKKPVKPLVLSFHGLTGTGKNYVAEMIAKSLYKKGMQSKFVHHIVATADFPDKTQIDKYQHEESPNKLIFCSVYRNVETKRSTFGNMYMDSVQNDLNERIRSAVNKCSRTLFIFDEVDKMPSKLLEAISPFLDHYSTVRGLDFRNSIFIFLSNSGSSVIKERALHQHRNGMSRDTLVLNDFEALVKKHGYNEKGGLKHNEIIARHLIDHYVPFLPLEKRHVVLCIKDYLEEHGHNKFVPDMQFISHIVEQLEYTPSDLRLFSASGCKRISAKTELALNQRRTRERGLDTADSFQFNDEL